MCLNLDVILQPCMDHNIKVIDNLEPGEMLSQ